MLPVELQEHILSYLHPYDKIYASMTCTLWANILKNNFTKSKKDILANCSYDMYMYFKDLDKIDISQNRYCNSSYIYITNQKSIYLVNFDINTLNMICHLHIKKKPFPDIKLSIILYNYCKLECTINKYVKHCIKYNKSDIAEMHYIGTVALNNKSYALAEYFLIFWGLVQMI